MCLPAYFSDLLTSALCSGDEGFPDLSDVEHRRSFHIIPVFLCERINTGKVFIKYFDLWSRIKTNHFGLGPRLPKGILTLELHSKPVYW